MFPGQNSNLGALHERRSERGQTWSCRGTSQIESHLTPLYSFVSWPYQPFFPSFSIVTPFSQSFSPVISGFSFLPASFARELFLLVVGTEGYRATVPRSGHGLLCRAVHEEHAYCRPSAPVHAKQANQASFQLFLSSIACMKMPDTIRHLVPVPWALGMGVESIKPTLRSLPSRPLVRTSDVVSRAQDVVGL